MLRLQVAPLCAAVRLLRLDMYALRSEDKAFQALLNLVTDQLCRHTHPLVAREAADTLLACMQHAPGSLQVSLCVLNSCLNARVLSMLPIIPHDTGIMTVMHRDLAGDSTLLNTVQQQHCSLQAAP